MHVELQRSTFVPLEGSCLYLNEFGGHTLGIDLEVIMHPYHYVCLCMAKHTLVHRRKIWL